MKASADPVTESARGYLSLESKQRFTIVAGVLGALFFLAQFVLRDPLSRAFALQYDVTGSWTSPIITRQTRITPSQSTEATK